MIQAVTTIWEAAGSPWSGRLNALRPLARFMRERT
jgi:hypothetical protein